MVESKYDLQISEEIDKKNFKTTVVEKKGIECLKSWTAEGMAAHGLWHEDAWLNQMFKDGKQWDQDSWDEAISKDIIPVTSNRIFGIIESLKGEYIGNQQYIQAKGRTQADSEISQLMTESISYVLESSQVYDDLPLGFEDMVTSGFSPYYIGHQHDPRKEKIIVQRRPWYSVFTDPFGDSYLDPARSRYVFYSDWKNTEDLCRAYPKHEYKIKEFIDSKTNENSFDVSQIVEDYIANSIGWTSVDGARCRPVEMFYAVNGKGVFAILPDGTAEELDPENPQRSFALLDHATSIITAKIKRIRKAVFLGDVLLEDIESPFKHGKYPYALFYAYFNRFNQPQGVPTNLREQNMEINRRRAMALALLGTRLIVIEEKAVDDPNTVFEEAQKINPLIIVKDGRLNSIKIDEMGGGLAGEQVEIMRETERLLKEQSGRNNEQMGYKSGANQSRVAFEAKVSQSSEQSASLFRNERRGRKMIGALVGDLIQTTDTWTSERVLRITDRVTASEKFHTLNEQFVDDDGEVTTKNNVAAGKFDYLIADAPVTDTVREKNVEITLAAINRAPQEAIGPLLQNAYELSNLPNKDALMERLNLSLGMQSIDHDQTKEQREQANEERRENLRAKEEADAQFKQQERELELEEKRASIQAKIITAETAKIKAETEKEKVNQDAYVKGYQLQQDILKQRDVHPAPNNQRYE